MVRIKYLLPTLLCFFFMWIMFDSDKKKSNETTIVWWWQFEAIETQRSIEISFTDHTTQCSSFIILCSLLVILAIHMYITSRVPYLSPLIVSFSLSPFSQYRVLYTKVMFHQASSLFNKYLVLLRPTVIKTTIKTEIL